jgi:2-dehydro-3-deoxy-D-gluconate 5-dehydrogenase
MKHRFLLTEKVALVTGATGGLGKAIAIGLAGTGANVIAVGRNKTILDEVINDIRDLDKKALGICADISNVNNVKEMVRTSIGEFGQIDILVNCAGISGPMKLFKDYEESEWLDIFKTNLNGTLLCTKYVGEVMIKKKKGKIINMASVLGTIGTYFTAPYGITKAGIIQFTKNIALEWSRFNILVNSISPGMFETEMVKNILGDPKATEVIIQGTPLRKIGKPDDIVGLVIFLASDASNHITGQNICIDGGFSMSKY